MGEALASRSNNILRPDYASLINYPFPMPPFPVVSILSTVERRMLAQAQPRCSCHLIQEEEFQAIDSGA